MFFSKNKH